MLARILRYLLSLVTKNTPMGDVPVWETRPASVDQKLLAGISSLTPITTSDDDDFTDLVQAVYCTDNGTMKVKCSRDSVAVTIPVFKGLNRIQCRRIYTTGTADCTPLWAAVVGDHRWKS
jgi:hypothetical protein